MGDDIKENLSSFAHKVALLSPVEKQRFLRHFFSYLPAKEQEEYIQILLSTVARGSKYQRIKKWMEGVYRKDFSKTPKWVAVVCSKTMGIDGRMLPLLIKLAQTTKNRIRMRKVRGSKEITICRGK